MLKYLWKGLPIVLVSNLNTSSILANAKGKRYNVTVPNEVILKDKHQQYVNVAESTLVRWRDTSAICGNTIGGLALVSH